MSSVQDDDYDILLCYKILSTKNIDYDLTKYYDKIIIFLI